MASTSSSSGFGGKSFAAGLADPTFRMAGDGLYTVGPNEIGLDVFLENIAAKPRLD